MISEINHNRTEKVEPPELPDGDYDATWGGFVVTFSIDEDDYETRSTQFQGSPMTPAIVRVRNGVQTVETKQ